MFGCPGGARAGVAAALAVLLSFTATPRAYGATVLSAGGAGYALAFDATREDIATLVLSSVSATTADELTVEYWLYLGDRMQDEHTTFAYSVYDSTKTPVYSQPNELSQHFSPMLGGVRNVRGLPSERLLCNVTICRDAVTPMTLPVPNPIVPAKPNRWMHITTVWIRLDGTLQMYVDGMAVWKGADGDSVDIKRNALLGGILGLGQDPDTMSGSFDETEAFTGIIDEFRMWRFAKSQEEVQTTYYLGVSPTHPRLDRLLVHLTFDDPMTAAAPADPFDFSTLGSILKAANGGDADPLLLGRLPPTHTMRYVTDRRVREPTRPRFVPSTVPTHVPPDPAPRITLFPPTATHVDVYLNAHSTNKSSLYSVLIEDFPTLGYVYLIAADGTQGARITAALPTVTSFPNINWCRNDPGFPSETTVECPFRVRYVPFSIPDMASTSKNRTATFTFRVVLDSVVALRYPQHVVGNSSKLGEAHVVYDSLLLRPRNVTFTVLEDTVAPVALGGVDMGGANIPVVVMSAPTAGKLYQVYYANPVLPQVYGNLMTDELTLGRESKLITDFPHIVASDATLVNDRSVVMFAPAADEYGVNYANVSYAYVRPDGTFTPTGLAIINVDAVNDAPNKDLLADQNVVCSSTNAGDRGACRLSIASGAPFNVKLNSTDVDLPASPVGATRNYQRVVVWPVLGKLYQVTPEGGQGAEITPAAVTYVTTPAASVRNASSESPAYPSSNLAGPRPAGEINAWLAASFSFLTADRKAGTIDETPVETVVLEIGPEVGDAYYLSGLILTESAHPGAVVGISVTSEYTGESTMWRDIYRLSTREGKTGSDWREFAPSICPVPVRAAFVKIEVDTSNTPGAFERFAGLQVTGSKAAPTGLVLHENADNPFDFGRVMYLPDPGMHVFGSLFDTMSYVSSDCVASSLEPMPVKISVSGPGTAAGFCGTRLPAVCDYLAHAEAFGYTSREEFFVEPDATTRVNLDASQALQTVLTKLGVSGDDVCTTLKTLKVVLEWERDRALTTTLATPPAPEPLSSLLGNRRKADGTYIASVVLGRNETCTAAAVTLPIFPIDLAVTIKDQGRFELDYWAEFQPAGSTVDPGAGSTYTTRHRVMVRMMCSVNTTHVHRADGMLGAIKRRTTDILGSQPLFMRQASWERTNDGACVGCHQVPAAQVAAILTDVVAQAHFELVCEVRFRKCAPGQLFDVDYFSLTGIFRCEACPIGTFQAVAGRLSTCSLCAPGSYFPTTGATACLSCREFYSVDSYQDQPGAAACLFCPKLTDGTGGKPRSSTALNLTNPAAGSSIDHCVCKVGYFHPDQALGVPCELCPRGAFCAGGIAQPVPCGAGLFADVAGEVRGAGANLTDLLRGVVAGRQGVGSGADAGTAEAVVGPDGRLLSGSSLVVQSILKQGVDIEAFCSRDEAFWGEPTHPSTFFPCEGNNCVGGVQFACDERHTGRMCQSCASGYYSIGEERCTKCPGSHADQVMVQFGAVVFVLAFWYLVVYLICTDFAQVDVFFTYLQVAALVQAFDIRWPTTVAYRATHVIFGVFNLDVDFVQPQCLVQWGYVSTFYLQMAFPAGVLTLCVLLNLGAQCARDAHMNNSRSALSKLTRALLPVVTDDGLRELADVVMQRFFAYCLVTYGVTAVTCFEPFMCTRAASGTYFLNAGPDVTCWDGDVFTWHSGLLATGAAGIALYVLGIPLMFAGVLAYGRQYNFLAHPRFLKVFGFLYTKFDVEYFWWELTFLARRFFLVMLVVFFEGTPSSQIAIAMLLFVLNIAAHSYARPFRKPDMDVADAVALISVSFYLVGAMLFNCFREMQPHQYTAVEVLTMVLLWGTTAALLVIGWNDVRKVRAGHLAEALMQVRLLAALEGVGLAYRKMGDDPEKVFREADTNKSGELDTEEFRAKLKDIDPTMDDALINRAFQLVDEDGSGTVSYQEFRKHMWRRFQPAMDGSELGLWEMAKAWVRKLCGIKHRQDDLDEVQIVFQAAIKLKMSRTLKAHNVELVGELVNTFQPQALHDFAKRERLDVNIAKFHQVDAWMSPIVADDSHVSAWSLSAEAVFFRNLVRGSPFLIDWLLTSCKEDKEVFRKLVTSFMACQNVVGHKGVYGKLVRSEDRAPMVYWLKDATSSQHLTLWEVMDAILIASANESTFIPRLVRPPTVADDWGSEVDMTKVLEGIRGPLQNLAVAKQLQLNGRGGREQKDEEAGFTPLIPGVDAGKELAVDLLI